MNFIDFTKFGGYRFEQPTMDKMQESYFFIFQAFIKYLEIPDIGNFILSGCEVSGANITDGILYIDGDLCPFSSVVGDSNSKIKKSIVFTDLSFNNGTNPPVFRNTSAVIDSTGVKLSDFVKVKQKFNNIEGVPHYIVDPADLTATPPELTILQRLELLEAMVAPIKSGNSPILFNGPANTVPAGYSEWTEMRGRLPIGYNPTDSELDVVGNDVGAVQHTITQGELPIIVNTWKPYSVGDTTNDFLSWKTTGTITPIKLLPLSKIVIYIIWTGI